MQRNYLNTKKRFTHILQPSQEMYSRSESSSSMDEAPPNFPFGSTPSGNLKLNPHQVVYESNKLSIVAADPRRTKVNIKASSSDQDMSAVDKKVFPLDLSKGKHNVEAGEESSGFGNMIRKQMRHMLWDTPQDGLNTQQSEYECEEDKSQKQTKNQALEAQEIYLSKMGFTNNMSVDWMTVDLPPKSDVKELLYHKISKYEHPDILITIGNHEYSCHMLVLRSYSGYFAALGPVTIVELNEKEVTKSAFETIYKWMVDNEVQGYKHILGRHNILEIFIASHHLKVKELEEQCWAFIDNEDLFSEDRAFLLYLDARAIGNITVMELMVPRIQRFFLTLVASRDFLDLVVDEVAVFLSSNYICIHCEMEVFMAGVRWLTYDWTMRQKHLITVMSCVRFALIPPWQLVDIRRNKANVEFVEITKNQQVSKMIEDGLAYAIIRYYCGNGGSNEYGHCVEVLGLVEPAPRNWSNESNPKNQKSYTSYKQFLEDLSKYRISHMEKSQKHGQGDKVSGPTCNDADYPPDMIRCHKST